jgi:hypothetical protein
MASIYNEVFSGDQSGQCGVSVHFVNQKMTGYWSFKLQTSSFNSEGIAGGKLTQNSQVQLHNE